MKEFLCRAWAMAVTGALLLSAVSSCVDDKYDLSKDIDGEIALGGNRFTIPASSTDTFTLRRILDLEENSTIVAVGENNRYGLRKGDYVLEQTGQDVGEPTVVHVDRVEIDEEKISLTEADARLEFDAVLSELLPDGFTLVEKVDNMVASFDMESYEIDEALVELCDGKVDCEVRFQLWFSNDNNVKDLTLEEGFEAAFDEHLTLVSNDPRIEIIDGHIVRLVKDLHMENDIYANPLLLQVSEINFEGWDGCGIIEPGHFKLASEIVANGKALVGKDDMPESGKAILHLHMRSDITNLDVFEVKAVVDPEVHIDIDPVEVTDIPDFLKENDVTLDLANPQLEFVVNSDMPIDIDFNANLVAIKDGTEVATVGLGGAYGTDPIVLKGNTETVLCLVRPGNTVPGVDVVEVPGLETILSSIPDQIRIDIADKDVHVVQKPATITLGRDYTVATEYRMAAPLSFGPDMQLVYTDVLDGWDADLEDVSVKKIEATLDVENTIPIEMDLIAEAIDVDGNVMENITVTVDGVIQGGTIEDPALSPLVLTVTSSDGKLDGIDGLNLEFRGRTPLGRDRQNLNEKQALKLLNVKVSVLGGVIVTL